MSRLERFLEILEELREHIEKVIGEENYSAFVEKAEIVYNDLVEEQKKYQRKINQYYLNWAIAAEAIYTALKSMTNIEDKQAFDLIYGMTYNATESIFIDMSFVQVAYYLICNRIFLKQLMLNSLAAFEPSDIEDILEEQEVDQELECSFKDSVLNQYFLDKGIPEFTTLVDRLDNIIDEYTEKQFTKKQRSLTLEDLF